MRRSLKYIFFVLFLWCTTYTSAWAYLEKDMRRLTIADGLPDNFIQRIHRTGDGMIWFGTRGGLARYDGSVIRRFVLPTSNQKITNLMSEPNSPLLWIWTGGTLCCLNTHTEQFIPVLGAETIYRYSAIGLKMMSDSIVWVASREGIALRAKILNLPVGKGKLVVVDRVEQIGLAPNERCRTVQTDKKRNIFWLSTSRDRLYSISDSSTECQSIRIKKTVHHPQAYIHRIDVIGSSLWLNTNGAGTIRYFPSNGSYVQIGVDQNGQQTLSNTTVFEVDPIDSTSFLLSTWNGYNRITFAQANPLTAEAPIETINYSNSYSDVHRRMESRMLTAHIDKDQIVWLGTAGGGVYISNLTEQFFNQWHQNASNAVESMAFDSMGRMWIATYHRGVLRSADKIGSNLPDRFTQALSSTRYTPSASAFGLSVDRNGRIWASGPRGRIVCFSPSADVESEYAIGERYYVFRLCFSPDSTVWIGTDQGLFRADRATLTQPKKIEAIGTRKVVDLALDTEGYLWCATSEGVVRYDPMDRHGPVCYGPQLYALALAINPNGCVYAGTDNGLLEIDPRTQRAVQYTTRHGLSNAYIPVVVQTSQGEVWLGNDSGISRFSRTEKTFQNYYFQGNNRSGGRSSNGTLFWGNNKSIAYFDPNERGEYYRRVAQTPVLITNLMIDKRLIVPLDTLNGRVLLDRPIQYTNRLVLGPEHNHFSLAVSNLMFNPAHEQYEYRMLPLIEHWTTTPQSTVSFSSVPAGTYTFEVRSATSFSTIERPVTRLEIEVEPFWFQSLWFKLLCAGGVALTLVFLVLRIRFRYRHKLYIEQLRAQIESSRAELEKERQIHDERLRFFNYTSHELRTPLTLVLSPAKELVADTSLPPAVRKKLHIIESNASQMLDEVTRTMQRYKIDSGTLAVTIRPTDLNSLLVQVVDSLSPLTVPCRATVEIVCHCPELFVCVELDEQKVSSALTNLIGNSIKYRQLDVDLHIEVGLELRNDLVVVSVRDNGQGIDPTLLPTVFEPYATGEHNRPMSATQSGLGLSLVRSVAERHGGSVGVESQVGIGSVFELRLPYRPTNAQTDRHTSPEANRETILVVDDNQELRNYIGSLFEGECRVLSASDATQALQTVDRSTIDIVLCDVVMPGIDGVEFCRQLTSANATAHIPVVLMSGISAEEKALDAVAVGAVDYIVKPFDPRVLKAKVHSILRMRRLLRRMYVRSVEDQGSNEHLVQRLVNTVEIHMADPTFGVDTLAQKLGVSPSTLRRVVRAATSMSVVDVVRDVRLTRAASLLVERTSRVAEVAEAVGYNDLSTFRTQFTRKFGISPSKFHSQ